MTLFNIPDFISDWRNASLRDKQIVIVRILGTSFFFGFCFAAGKVLVGVGSAETYFVLVVRVLIAVGYGLISGASCGALAAVSLGIPISIPKPLLDEMAKDETLNPSDKPK